MGDEQAEMMRIIAEKRREAALERSRDSASQIQERPLVRKKRENGAKLYFMSKSKTWLTGTSEAVGGPQNVGAD